ncbi:hypothetical protein [Cryobacterium sp. Sr8]|uniref:hypothetical protein n=1 Tax=Cryobacterium sp. Sr8 TaxID=1259203 RepID=UPI001F5467FD|nr:hypothetical protein [Cryobacterium sp. Sr8]
MMQALLGHTHVDTTARYIHLAPAHVKAEYDAACNRQRTTPEAAAKHCWRLRRPSSPHQPRQTAYTQAAKTFLDRFPHVQDWAERPLNERRSASQSLRPFLTLTQKVDSTGRRNTSIMEVSDGSASGMDEGSDGQVANEVAGCSVASSGG